MKNRVTVEHAQPEHTLGDVVALAQRLELGHNPGSTWVATGGDLFKDSNHAPRWLVTWVDVRPE